MKPKLTCLILLLLGAVASQAAELPVKLDPAGFETTLSQRGPNLIAGQPTTAGLLRAKQAGVTAVISLRTAEESKALALMKPHRRRPMACSTTTSLWVMTPAFHQQRCSSLSTCIPSMRARCCCTATAPGAPVICGPLSWLNMRAWTWPAPNNTLPPLISVPRPLRDCWGGNCSLNMLRSPLPNLPNQLNSEFKLKT